MRASAIIACCGIFIDSIAICLMTSIHIYLSIYMSADFSKINVDAVKSCFYISSFIICFNMPTWIIHSSLSSSDAQKVYNEVPRDLSSNILGINIYKKYFKLHTRSMQILMSLMLIIRGFILIDNNHWIALTVDKINDYSVGNRTPIVFHPSLFLLCLATIFVKSTLIAMLLRYVQLNRQVIV